jgi:hypothetical protein
MSAQIATMTKSEIGVIGALPCFSGGAQLSQSPTPAGRASAGDESNSTRCAGLAPSFDVAKSLNYGAVALTRSQREPPIVTAAQQGSQTAHSASTGGTTIEVSQRALSACANNRPREYPDRARDQTGDGRFALAKTKVNAMGAITIEAAHLVRVAGKRRQRRVPSTSRHSTSQPDVSPTSGL